MTDVDIIKKIENRIDSYENDMVALQIALTAIPALAPENGGDGEYEKARYLMEYLKSMKFNNISRFDAPDDRVSSNCRPNIIVN
ncbi:MAG: M20 family metallo-hydrolase, partial [Thermodesulfobacteriota bacterium]|nr:M20 family metallo-hydrolase [Thermodesulfobacteriota bacterium]